MSRDHLEALGVMEDGRTILKWVIKNGMEGCGLESPGSELGPEADSSEYGNELLGSIIGGDLLEELSDYKHLKKYSAPWN
jgi:hypothetical protein